MSESLTSDLMREIHDSDKSVDDKGPLGRDELAVLAYVGAASDRDSLVRESSSQDPAEQKRIKEELLYHYTTMHLYF